MALETVVFQLDPFSIGCKSFYNIWGVENYDLGCIETDTNLNNEELEKSTEQVSNGTWEASINSSSGICTGNDGFIGAGEDVPAVSPIVMSGRRKRKRTKSYNNTEDIENQRMTHIAVERNRRRQMNDYFAVIRSMMPPSYSPRGDQASIVSGAINFVKELEHLLQFLEAHSQVKQQPISSIHSKLFTDFFTFPQHSILCNKSMSFEDGMSQKRSTIADIEVTMAERHANIKILARRHPKQLLAIVRGLHSLSLSILHLSITTVDQLVLYLLSIKVEDDCQLNSVNDIATAVHELMSMIDEAALADEIIHRLHRT